MSKSRTTHTFVLLPTSTSDIQEIDTQLHIFASFATDSVLHCVNMERHSKTVDGEDHALVSTINIYLGNVRTRSTGNKNEEIMEDLVTHSKGFRLPRKTSLAFIRSESFPSFSSILPGTLIFAGVSSNPIFLALSMELFLMLTNFG